MTTEEFLQAAQRDPQLAPPQRSLLGTFLAEADLVKFARYVPAPTMPSAPIAPAREFVRLDRAARGAPCSCMIRGCCCCWRWCRCSCARAGGSAPPALRYPVLDAVRAVGPGRRARWRWLLPALRVAALVLLVVALARPQLGKAATQIYTEGIDIMLAVDISGSMLAEDFQVDGQRASRLDAVKAVVREVPRRSGPATASGWCCSRRGRTRSRR